MEAFMSIQKKILPLFGLLILTQNQGLANWWEAAKNTAEKAATSAWNENKGAITTAAQNAWQQNQGKVSAAAKAGEGVITDGGNFREAVDKAERTFDTTKSAQTADPRGLQQQAQAKLTVFSQSPHVTDKQKTALQSLYQQQQYQPVITVIEKTDDVFTMLARTPDAVKKANENNLTQMSQAFNEVTSANILNVTNSVYKFIKGIAPAAPAGTSTTGVNSMSEAEFEEEVIETVEKRFGPFLQQVATMMKQVENMMKQSDSQRNISTTQTQPTNNIFMSAANG